VIWPVQSGPNLRTEAGNQVGEAPGLARDGIPDWGIFDFVEPSSSGNQHNGRVDYAHGNDQFFVNTFLVSPLTTSTRASVRLMT
jgi:hypothetical protein